jgi:hypothetical protein
MCVHTAAAACATRPVGRVASPERICGGATGGASFRATTYVGGGGSCGVPPWQAGILLVMDDPCP